MNFTKMHGLGNDFIIINMLNEEQRVQEIVNSAKTICDRNFGVGGDGILLVLPSECADIKMQIINSDGSEAEMCGNGIRCFAKYVYEQDLVKKTTMTVETLAGIMVPELILNDQGDVSTIKVDMGEPILNRPLIPMRGDEEQAIDTLINIEGRELAVTGVSMGNPHCITFVDDIAQADIYKWGPLIEKCSYFPKKVNAEFVQIKNEQEVIMRVWERGASVTLACGTGACATVVACVLNDKTKRKVTVHLDGGQLLIEWDEQSNHVFMTGTADTVFHGQLV